MDSIAVVNLTSMVRAASVGVGTPDVVDYSQRGDGQYTVLTLRVGEFAVHTVNPATGAVTNGLYFDRDRYTDARDEFTRRVQLDAKVWN